MTLRVRVLLAAIGLAVVVGIFVWIVRYQPLGPSEPLGTPLPSNAVAAAGWTDAGEAPFARLEMATAVLDGRFWLAGGFNPDGWAVDVLAILDPASGDWTEGPTLPAPVHHAAMASDGAVLYLVGGYLASGQPTSDVHVLDPVAGEWTAGPALPEERAAGALAHDGERLVYAGGVGPGGLRSEVFVLVGEAWVELGVLARPREHLAAVSDGEGRVWVMGGRQGGLDRNVGDVEVVESSGVELVASLTPRGGVAAFFAPGTGACLTGGEAPSFALTTVECVDASGRVTAFPSMQQPRHGHGAGVVDGVAHVLLGGDVPGLDATPTVEALRLID